MFKGLAHKKLDWTQTDSGDQLPPGGQGENVIQEERMGPGYFASFISLAGW